MVTPPPPCPTNPLVQRTRGVRTGHFVPFPAMASTAFSRMLRAVYPRCQRSKAGVRIREGNRAFISFRVALFFRWLTRVDHIPFRSLGANGFVDLFGDFSLAYHCATVFLDSHMVWQSDGFNEPPCPTNAGCSDRQVCPFFVRWARGGGEVPYFSAWPAIAFNAEPL